MLTIGINKLPLQVLFVAKPEPQSKRQSRNSAVFLFLLIFGLSIGAGLLFRDYREVRYGWFITVLWLVVAAFSCGFGIIYYAQFVLPHHEGENWLEGIAMMLRAATQFGPSPSQPQRSIRSVKLPVPDTEILSPSFKTLKAGMVPSHQAVSIGRGDGLVNAVGPGFIRLQPGETPVQAIDLRRYVRTSTATANTRDGIPLETKVTIVFQVKQSERDHEGDHLEYPYDRSAVLWVSQLNTFDQDNTIHTWSEQLTPQATTYMISEIAQFTLDELWQDPVIFNGIQQRIRRQLRSTFDEWGIKVHQVKVAPVKVPDEIVEQRLANWRAPWQSQILAQAAAGDAEALRRVKLARARAQVEIIESIMLSIDEMRQAEEGSLPEIVTLRVIDILDEAATKSTSHAYLPSQVLASIVSESPDQLSNSQESNPPEGEDSDI